MFKSLGYDQHFNKYIKILSRTKLLNMMFLVESYQLKKMIHYL